MDKYSVYAGQLINFKEYFPPKDVACNGSGAALAFRLVFKAINDKSKGLAGAEMITSSDSLLGGTQQSAKTAPVPMLQIPKAGDDMNMLVCFDTEPTKGSVDTDSLIKRVPAVAAASGYSYVATACPSHPFDLIEKVITGFSSQGSAYIHILCPSPGGWGFDPQNTVRIGRIAVETQVFPLYEIADGYYNLTIDEPNTRPIADYLTSQERFAAIKGKKAAILQQDVAGQFAAIKEKSQQCV